MRHLLICVFTFTASIAFSQRYQDYLALGDMAIEAKDPYGALRYYKIAMDLDSSRTSLHYKLASAYRLNANYSKAAYYYYKVYRKERGRVYEDSGMRLAEMQMQCGNYDSAKDYWRRVRDQFADDKQSYPYLKALQAMRSCDLAKVWLKEKSEVKLEQLPNPVNTDASEFAGFFKEDGSLFFTSLRGEVDKDGKLLSDNSNYAPHLMIADSSMKNIEFYEDASVLSVISSPDKEFSAFLKRSSEDQTSIEVLHEGDLVLKFPAQDEASWYSQPAFGKIGDDSCLFFTSNRPEGYGKEDIWYILLSDLNALPINAGPSINSPGSELTPFFNFEENVLYFASDWHHGMGGFDLFQSTLDEESFEIPENLKPPFSSPANDLYYSYNGKIGKGTISTNRVNGNDSKYSDCCNDIWAFNREVQNEEKTLPVITNLEMLNDYLPVKLYFHNDEPDPATRKTTTEKSYEETYRDYISRIEEYRSEYRKGLSETGSEEAEDAMDNFFLNEVDEGMSNLKLFTELLLRELKSGARIELTVKGFASPLAETDYNVNLTSRRIASLENYLMDFDGGSISSFLNGGTPNSGSLNIIRIPFGEYVANTSISDNPNESDAIYSIGAALERKIEIISIQEAPEEDKSESAQFSEEIINLGQINSGDQVSFEFRFEGSKNLTLSRVEFDREALSLYGNLETFVSEERIQGEVNTNNSPGLHRETITVKGNFLGRSKELILTYEILSEK